MNRMERLIIASCLCFCPSALLLSQDELFIEEVFPRRVTMGDVITITGGGFGFNPQALCVIVMNDSLSIPLRAISATENRVLARVGVVPPNARPGPIAVERGNGTIGVFQSSFDDVVVEGGAWAWTSLGDSPFVTDFDIDILTGDPPAREEWLSSGPPEDGKLCVYLDRDWEGCTTITVTGRLANHESGLTCHFDTDDRAIRFTVPGGPALECAKRICDAITNGIGALKDLVVGVECEVTQPDPDGPVKITLGFEDMPVEWGHLSICTAEVECRDGEGDVAKWFQPPNENDGFAAASGIDWRDMDPNIVTADDFVSDGRPITGVRFWGSYVDLDFRPPEFEGSDSEEVDGWLISFHVDKPDVLHPTDLLGVYFCPSDAITIDKERYLNCDNLDVFRYGVRLADCCAIHMGIPDPRDGSKPATRDSFDEVRGVTYWLGVQAVVGHTFDPDECGDDPGPEIITSHNAAADFWGWHTSHELRLKFSQVGSVMMDGEDWVYDAWDPLEPPLECSDDVNQAFALLTDLPDRPRFVRGDWNADGAINLADGVASVLFLFSTGAAASCSDAGDSNDDGVINIADPIYLLDCLFRGGGFPPPPTPVDPGGAMSKSYDAARSCGPDPTMDGLNCASFPPC